MRKFRETNHLSFQMCKHFAFNFNTLMTYIRSFGFIEMQLGLEHMK